MHHFFRIVAFVGLTCLAVTPPAAADPISITAGFIVVPGPVEGGPISIAGTRGFSIEGRVLRTKALWPRSTSAAVVARVCPARPSAWARSSSARQFKAQQRWMGTSDQLTGDDFNDPAARGSRARRDSHHAAAACRLPDSGNRAIQRGAELGVLRLRPRRHDRAVERFGNRQLCRCLRPSRFQTSRRAGWWTRCATISTTLQPRFRNPPR